MSNLIDQHPDLKQESIIFSQYLIGKFPPDELITRYIQGNQTLFLCEPTKGEASLLNFCRKNEWSVSFLDGGAGFLASENLLRKKILLMSAVLETSPKFADDFLPKPVRWSNLIFQSMVGGLGTFVSLLFGVPLYFLLGGNRK